jgi:phospholipid transport system substrate-binding protein
MNPVQSKAKLDPGLAGCLPVPSTSDKKAFGARAALPGTRGRSRAGRRSGTVKRGRTLFVAMVFSVFASVLVPVGTASAGNATDVVKAKQGTLFDLLKQGGAASQPKIGAIFDEMLDYQSLAEASLGNEWAARSDAEKAEFSDLLKQLVRKSYEKNLKKTLNFNLEYAGEGSKAGAVVVKTKATSKTNAREEPVTIDYVMVEKNGAWRIKDIVTDDVSLVSSYRSQFTKIIKKDGFPALIKKMKDKLAKGETS